MLSRAACRLLTPTPTVYWDPYAAGSVGRVDVDRQPAARRLPRHGQFAGRAADAVFVTGVVADRGGERGREFGAGQAGGPAGQQHAVRPPERGAAVVRGGRGRAVVPAGEAVRAARPLPGPAAAGTSSASSAASAPVGP